jgi:hypothetical protein
LIVTTTAFGIGANDAITFIGAFIAILTGFIDPVTDPVAPVHSTNLNPGAGVAVSCTVVPLA